jgi:membrane protein DedA with SNARE-associated domain
VSSSIESFLAHNGLWAVFILMAVDAVFPAASELVMVYGGALASGALVHELDVLGHPTTGFWAFVAVVAAGTLGYLAGAIGGWAIGLYGGRPFLERHGRFFHLGEGQLDRAERWFDRWEDRAVLFGRVTPVVRSFVSIPAGVFEVPLRRYTILTAIGSFAWCLAFAGAGWALGASWDSLDHRFKYVEYLIVAVVVALAGYLLVRRRRSTTMATRGDSSR